MNTRSAFANPFVASRARLHRRGHHAISDEEAPLPRPQHAAQQDARKSLEEARQHSALKEFVQQCHARACPEDPFRKRQAAQWILVIKPRMTFQLHIFCWRQTPRGAESPATTNQRPIQMPAPPIAVALVLAPAVSARFRAISSYQETRAAGGRARKRDAP